MSLSRSTFNLVLRRSHLTSVCSSSSSLSQMATLTGGLANTRTTHQIRSLHSHGLGPPLCQRSSSLFPAASLLASSPSSLLFPLSRAFPFPFSGPSAVGLSLHLKLFSTSPSSRNTKVPPSASPSPPPPSPSPPPPSSPTSKKPLSEDIVTIPNLLTISRLLLTPYIGYLVATHQFTPACICLFVAGLTDLLDGWVARRTNKYTVFGSIADPAADKALVTTMVISLGLSGMMPIPLMALILSRDLALVVSAFIIRYRTLESPKTLKRYFNPTLPSAQVTPTAISKYNTFLQLLLVGVLTILPVLFPPTDDESDPSSSNNPNDHNDTSETETYKPQVDRLVLALEWIVAITTLWSGISYLRGAGSSKILGSKLKFIKR